MRTIDTHLLGLLPMRDDTDQADRKERQPHMDQPFRPFSLLLLLGLLVASSTTGGAAVPPSGQNHRVSVVFACLEVPETLHSFKHTDLRDAFAGTIGEAGSEEPFLHWATGMWDYETLLEDFDPSEGVPEDGEQRAETVWKAKRDGEDYLVARLGWGLYFGRVRTGEDEETLRAVFASVRRGSEDCAESEPPLPGRK